MKLLNKQYWQNNAWWGEKSRERNQRHHERAPERLITLTWAEPEPGRVWGVDTSHWDGNVDFRVTKATGASFAIIKCMDGTVPTRFWPENYGRAAGAGLIVGSYCWLYPDKYVSCRAQAQAVFERIRIVRKQLPLTVDFEWSKFQGLPANPNYTDLDIFLTEFIRLAGYRPMVYTAAGFTNPLGRVPDSIKSKVSYWWIANYGVTAPLLPLGLSGWTFWQFASSGEARVIAPNDSGKLETDLNYFNGTEKELFALAGVDAPPDGETMPYRYEAVSTYNMSLRPDHNVNNSPTGSVLAGQKMRGDVVWEATGEQWLQVVEVNSVAKSGWVAIVHMGKTYCHLTDNKPVDPPELLIPDYLIAHYGDGTERKYVPE